MVDGYGENHSKKKKKGKRTKKVVTAEQVVALNCVRKWVLPSECPGAVGLDDFAANNVQMLGEPLLFEMHSHSVHSDGFLTPSALVERAHRNGVSGCSLSCLYPCTLFDRTCEIILVFNWLLHCLIYTFSSVYFLLYMLFA